MDKQNRINLLGLPVTKHSNGVHDLWINVSEHVPAPTANPVAPNRCIPTPANAIAHRPLQLTTRVSYCGIPTLRVGGRGDGGHGHSCHTLALADIQTHTHTHTHTHTNIDTDQDPQRDGDTQREVHTHTYRFFLRFFNTARSQDKYPYLFS